MTTTTAFSISEAELQQVRIDAHRSGKCVEIDMFEVPEGLRRRGLGTAAYRAWEKKLPKSVRQVRLFAADTEGEGNSDDFWASLGFRPTYRGDECDMSYDQLHDYRKGVNGARTPEPIEIEPHDAGDDE